MARMVVCVCNRVSDADIRRKVEEGVSDFETLQEQTDCSTCCGCCEDMARELLAEAVLARDAASAKPFSVPFFGQPVAA